MAGVAKLVADLLAEGLRTLDLNADLMDERDVRFAILLQAEAIDESMKEEQETSEIQSPHKGFTC